MKMVKSLLFFIVTALLVFVKGNHEEEQNKKSEEISKFYELNRGKVSAKFTNYGATIVSLNLPDKNGKLADVVLGYDTINEYKNGTKHFGATVGRVANRIGGAQFTLNGTTYKLIPNSGNNSIYGGPKGYSNVVWTVKKYHNQGNAPYITFSYHSFDGEQGFPGALEVFATFRLVKKGMTLKMEAKALNKSTPVNLSQHVSWNLGGHNSGDILSNEIQLFASNIIALDKSKIPTGKIISVKGTPYDFLNPAIIKKNMKKLPDGYDINYVVDDDGKRMKKVAIVFDKKSGRMMELFSNQQTVHFYTSNYLKNMTGKDGFVYQAHDGFSLETQGYPDAVNHPNFPSQIVNPGETYTHRMVFKFSIHRVS